MSNVGFSLNYNYCNLVVGGRPLSMWLIGYADTPLERNTLSWALIHICFGIYHMFGPFHEEEDHEILMSVAACYGGYGVERLGSAFFIYLYHAVVGLYGHLPPTESYLTVVQDIANTVYIGNTTTFTFTPASHLREIPYPDILPFHVPNNTDDPPSNDH